MYPNLRNLFMKKLTRARVVPIISASVSWLIFPTIGSVSVSFPKFARSKEKSREAPFAGIEQLVDEVLFDSTVTSQQICHEQLRKVSLIMKGSDHGRLGYAGDQAFFHRAVVVATRNPWPFKHPSLKK
jgi:hypothetical protein